MNKTSIIVGMGIGQLYKQVLTELGHTVVTVDLDSAKGAEFTDIHSAIEKYKNFDTAHICTPNFAHQELANKLAPHSKIVFVEKPGVVDSDVWSMLVEAHKDTRFVMVKNNQWRDNIDKLRDLANRSYLIEIKWINDDRVPSPGTWFTTKSLAYGGVSRDLMPHLLSIFMTLEPDYKNATQIRNSAMRVWNLDDLTKTDYGTVNKNGTYDVDDYCAFSFSVKDKIWNLETNWRSKTGDDRAIVFHLNSADNVLNSSNTVRIELGLCPENAYKNMISDCLKNLNNVEFWQNQLEQDLYIHQRIENIEI